MNIKFISKIPLSNFPRLISIPYALTKLGHEVTIIAPGELPEILLKNEKIKLRRINVKSGASDPLTKIITWITYRFEVFRVVKNLNLNDIFWLSSADSAIPLVGKINKYNFILQINELYDKYPAYRFFLHKLSKYATTIVVPEYNRANIFQVWFKLTNTPIILPNKSILPDREIVINKDVQNAINKINELKSVGYKILIYQGMIEKRRNLNNLLEILHELPFKVFLVLMGKNFGMVEKYKNKYENILFVPFINPPSHLQITKLADIGILYYNPDELNQIFCAPNKTWEYSKYGIPFISNDIPGMRIATKFYKAGISCNFNRKDELKNSIIEIIKNHSEYSQNAIKMYNDLDYMQIIAKIIDNTI
jgi:glycosyltransferase involved in cell wall biosynthesis